VLTLLPKLRDGIAKTLSRRAGGGEAMALKEGSRIFLRFESPSRGRLLQPGIVQEIQEGGWALAFETRHLAV
jgi:hypothetical protein